MFANMKFENKILDCLGINPSRYINYLFYLTNSIEESRDIFQDILCDFLSRRAEFEHKDCTEIIRITYGAMRNKCNGFFRRKNRNVFGDLDEKKLIYNNNLNFDLKSIINECMNKLKEPEKSVFEFFRIDGLNHSEISNILGITVSNSQQIKLRAENHLRECLRKRGIYKGFISE